MLFGEQEVQVRAAILLIGRTPGYADTAQELAGLLARGKIRFVPTLEDRGQATLTGAILIGPEPFQGSALGMAETLVHEVYHLHQFPLLKTASFWTGIVTGTPTMRRYERPAYEAALRFLVAVEMALPEWAVEARSEREAVAATFANVYGDTVA
jgi:hypothetical protein